MKRVCFKQATTGLSQLPMRTRYILVNLSFVIKGQSVVLIRENGADEDDFGLTSKLQL